MLLSPF